MCEINNISFVYLFILETGSPSVTQADLESTMEPSLP